MIITLLILCFVLLLLYDYFQRYGKFGQYINRIPGNTSLPIIGNGLEIFALWTRKYYDKLSNTYYPIFKFWLFHLAFIGIRHPDDVEIILSNSKQHLQKGFIYTFLYPWLRTGLLTSEGAKWHKRRKILTPAFHFNMLKQFVDVFIEEGNYMTQCLKGNEELIVNDLISFVSQHTLNAICETAMGTSLKNVGEFQQQYREAVHEMGKFITKRVLRPWYYPDMIFSFSSMGRMQAKCLKILHGFTEKIIAERKQYHESTNRRYLKQFENDSINNDEEVIGNRKKRLAMLDLLIAAQYNNELNDLDIREEVDTFMFEGHDTVAMGMTFAILLLAEHKDIQDRVRSEVNAVMKENDGKLTMSALNNMPYLERCLKESLRLYPSVPIITRVISEDVKLQSYMVPSGAILHISIKNVHRDPNFWPNPDVFDPDRFLPENCQNRHPFSYIPFSAGSRNCIGQRFAMFELKALIAPLVHNFYFEPIDYLKDLQLPMDIILRVEHPIRLKFIPIKYI
ncbi:cytochrome P450 4C1-like [Linepithema humile]|uniref:cytochrome P450 4C1-like n=1 Tax=Linepithema humile TaxID=83485 RepID=UPI00351E097A